MEFGAAIKSDSSGQWRGAVKCTVTPQGLTLTKGKKQPPVFLAVGTPATWESGNKLAVDAGDGRHLRLAVNKFGSYQGRLAADVAAFLRGERPPPAAADYKLEPFLLVVGVLPFGILFVTRGGALWGALGGALTMISLAVAQNERTPVVARLGVMLVIAAAAYAFVVALMAAAAGGATVR